MKMLKPCLIAGALSLLFVSSAWSAIALDRTRVIFDAKDNRISLNISNDNKTLPYLAQAWMEDLQGSKISSPLTVLPPIQRVEPGARSMLVIQSQPALQALPQDRESVFYLNLREIPPKTDKANVLQIALQTRIKLFYRPSALALNNPVLATPWQEKITLSISGERVQVNNPTPYFITLISARPQGATVNATGFKPLMIPPLGSVDLGVKASSIGITPEFSYINDYGGRPTLTLQCAAGQCHVVTNRVK